MSARDGWWTRGALSRRAASGWTIAFAVVAVMAIAAAGCSKDAATNPSGTVPNITSATIREEGTPVDGGSLTIGVTAETPGWNQHDEQWPYWSVIVGSSVFEPLATVDGDLNVQPWLATSWTPNATYDSWTIKLRENVTFHNGEKLDASAVKLNIDDYAKGTTTGIVFKDVIRGTTVIDPLTVRIDLSKPWAAFPNTFLAGQSYVMAPEMLSSPDRGKEHPIGTGPFSFVSWQRDVAFKVTKNKSYWQQGKPHLDNITFTVIGDPSAQTSALQAENIDAMYTLSYQPATTLEQQGFTVIKDWQSVPQMAMTNTVAAIDGKPNPLANLHARKALAFATNQQALAESIGPGLLLPKSPISNATKWGVPDDQTGYPAFDLQKARDEVEQYKKETGAPSLSISLSLATDSDFATLAQAVQAQWREAGIETTIQSKLASEFILDTVTGKYEVALFALYKADDPDFNNYFWTSDNSHPVGQISINFNHYSSAQMDQNVKTGRENPGFEVRKKAYDDIVREGNANALNIWTYYTPFSLIAAKKVHGLQRASETSLVMNAPVWMGDLWVAR